MEKRSIDVGYSDITLSSEDVLSKDWLSPEEDVWDGVLTVEYTELVLLKDVKLTLIGKVTGAKYVWNGAGSSVLVDKQDADLIIQKDKERESCCGSRTSKYFEVRS